MNLGKQPQEKLFIYEGDIPEIAVDSFSKIHNLTADKQYKLLSVVKEQLAKLYPTQDYSSPRKLAWSSMLLTNTI